MKRSPATDPSIVHMVAAGPWLYRVVAPRVDPPPRLALRPLAWTPIRKRPAKPAKPPLQLTWCDDHWECIGFTITKRTDGKQVCYVIARRGKMVALRSTLWGVRLFLLEATSGGGLQPRPESRQGGMDAASEPDGDQSRSTEPDIIYLDEIAAQRRAHPDRCLGADEPLTSRRPCDT